MEKKILRNLFYQLSAPKFFLSKTKKRKSRAHLRSREILYNNYARGERKLKQCNVITSRLEEPLQNHGDSIAISIAVVGDIFIKLFPEFAEETTMFWSFN